VSGTTPNNFTSPVLYVVTASDGTTVTYTVTVKTLTAATAFVTNGPVYAVVVGADGTTYIGGSFSQLRPATGSGVPIARNNIAAIDSTGAVTPWDPNANGFIYALAVSGSTVYTGGSFTNIGGQTRYSIAAIDSTGAAITEWNPYADNDVYALAVSGSTVYAGGSFTIIGGQLSNSIAAIDSSTGVATAWNPSADNDVRALAVSGSTVYAGGDFSSIEGDPFSYFAILSK
jgi:hypothetical protein